MIPSPRRPDPFRSAATLVLASALVACDPSGSEPHASPPSVPADDPEGVVGFRVELPGEPILEGALRAPPLVDGTAYIPAVPTASRAAVARCPIPPSDAGGVPVELRARVSPAGRFEAVRATHGGAFAECLAAGFEALGTELPTAPSPVELVVRLRVRAPDAR